MPTMRELEHELAAAFEASRPPAFALASTEEWVKAIDAQLAKGRYDAAEFAVRSLNRLEPKLDWARNMCALFERGQVVAPAAAHFHDDRRKDLQIVERESADTVVLCFCGAMNRIGMPLAIFHRWLVPLPAHVVYLRDFRKCLYLEGVPSLGRDMRSTVAALRKMADDLGARRILCLGSSSGGYAALRYSLELAADAVLSFAGPVNLEPEFNARLSRFKFCKRVRKEHPDDVLDLRALYANATARPRVTIVYGEHSWDDRLHAEHMGTMPGVRLLPMAGHGEHGVITELIKRDAFGPLLAEFFQGAA